MTDRIPIIFVHDGDQKYFAAAVAQAKKISSDVVIIDMKDDTDQWHEFEKNYIHLSTNSENIEMFCFKRYFLMQKYMTENSIDVAILLDSDVLIFEDLRILARELISAGFSGGLCMPSRQDDMRMSYSAHTSVWTAEYLIDFCTYCTYVYKNERDEILKKWAHHKDNNKNGGVCDMTLLYMWANKRQGLSNLLKIRDGKAVDDNISFAENCEPEEFEMRYGLKKLKFTSGMPVGQRSDGSRVLFRTLHFQGRAKAHMINVYENGSIRSWPYIKRDIRGRISSLINTAKGKFSFK